MTLTVDNLRYSLRAPFAPDAFMAPQVEEAVAVKMIGAARWEGHRRGVPPSPGPNQGGGVGNGRKMELDEAKVVSMLRKKEMTSAEIAIAVGRKVGMTADRLRHMERKGVLTHSVRGSAWVWGVK